MPSGVLCLAELDDNDIGRGVFDAVAYGQLWAFSLGGNGKAEARRSASRLTRCHPCKAQPLKRCPACTSSLRPPGDRRRRHQVDA
jgi:hypothetical protein